MLEAITESSPCWVIVKTKTAWHILETTEFGPLIYPERQSGASHQGLRCVCLGWVCHVGHPGMLRVRAIPSPDQGSHSFFQIENQPWGFRLLIESASDCGCSNYSCEVPLGPATQAALSSRLGIITRVGAWRGCSCWGLGEPFRSTGLVHGVIDLGGKPKPNWGMSCSRINRWEMADMHAACGSSMLV